MSRQPCRSVRTGRSDCCGCQDNLRSRSSSTTCKDCCRSPVKEVANGHGMHNDLSGQLHLGHAVSPRHEAMNEVPSMRATRRSLVRVITPSRKNQRVAVSRPAGSARRSAVPGDPCPRDRWRKHHPSQQSARPFPCRNKCQLAMIRGAVPACRQTSPTTSGFARSAVIQQAETPVLGRQRVRNEIRVSGFLLDSGLDSWSVARRAPAVSVLSQRIQGRIQSVCFLLSSCPNRVMSRFGFRRHGLTAVPNAIDGTGLGRVVPGRGNDERGQNAIGANDDCAGTGATRSQHRWQQPTAHPVLPHRRPRLGGCGTAHRDSADSDPTAEQHLSKCHRVGTPPIGRVRI